MKKFLSICLCAALLTGGFGGGLSAFAAKTSTDEILYPASDTPDKINEAGQKAINAQSYTTEDGVDVELPAIEVIRELDFPASKDVSYIRLFYYPHGCTPPAEKFYLITDKSQIETIRQALLATKAECTTSAYGATGYDIKDYKTEFSMEVHTKDGVEVWNTLYGVDTYLMKLEDKLTGDYDDMPFVTKNVAPLTNVLNKLRANSSTSLASTLPKQPVIRKVDTKAHTFVSSEDLKSSDRSKVNASYQKLKPYSSSLSGNVINPNVYFRLNDSNSRFKLQQTENGAELSLYTSSPNEYTQKVSVSDKSFFTTFDSLSKNLPTHPSWFCGILEEPNIAVSYAKEGSKTFQPMSASCESDMQKLLGKITVKKDSFQKVSKNYTVKNAFTLKVRDLAENREHVNSTYLISITDTLLLIQNNSVSYGAQYQLNDGKETKAAFEKALNLSEVNHYANAYSQMVLQLIQNSQPNFQDCKSIFLDFQSSPLTRNFHPYVCDVIQSKLDKQGYSITVTPGDFDTLLDDRKNIPNWQDKDSVLIRIQDEWDGSNKADYTIRFRTAYTNFTTYPVNTIEYQGQTWSVESGDIVSA